MPGAVGLALAQQVTPRGLFVPPAAFKHFFLHLLSSPTGVHYCQARGCHDTRVPKRMAIDSMDVQLEGKSVVAEILEPAASHTADPSREVSRKRQSLSDLFTIVSGTSKQL